MKFTFEFFRDRDGRLRAHLQECNVTRPMESREGKRYRPLKPFNDTLSRYGVVSEHDVYRLACAQAGDIVEIEVEY